MTPHLGGSTAEARVNVGLTVAGVFILFGVFVCLDLFLLFLFYEIAVLPVYLLIGIWGSSKRTPPKGPLVAMLIGRFLMMIPILALAGSLAQKRIAPASAKLAGSADPIPTSMLATSRAPPSDLNSSMWILSPKPKSRARLRMRRVCSRLRIGGAPLV